MQVLHSKHAWTRHGIFLEISFCSVCFALDMTYLWLSDRSTKGNRVFPKCSSILVETAEQQHNSQFLKVFDSFTIAPSTRVMYREAEGGLLRLRKMPRIRKSEDSRPLIKINRQSVSSSCSCPNKSNRVNADASTLTPPRGKAFSRILYESFSHSSSLLSSSSYSISLIES
jgi:hypothetical protein